MSYFNYFDINNVQKGLFIVIPNSYKKKLINDFINTNRENVVEFTKYNFPPIFYKIVMKDDYYKELYKILQNYSYDLKYNLENIKSNLGFDEYAMIYESDYQLPIRDGKKEYKIAITCKEIDEYLTELFKYFNEYEYSKKTINNIEFCIVRLRKININNCEINKELHKFYNREKLDYYKLFPEQLSIKSYNETIFDDLYENKLEELFIKEHSEGNCSKYSLIETIPSILEVNIKAEMYDRIMEEISKIQEKYPNEEYDEQYLYD